MEIIITGLEALFAWIVRTSWQSSVVIALVLLAQWLFRNRLTARWRYALWFLVLVRMLLPVAPESRMSVFNAAQLWAAPQPVDAAPALPVQIPFEESAEMSYAKSGTAPAAIQRSLPGFRTLFIFLWFAVVLLLAFRTAVGNYRLSSRVCRQRPLTDQTLLDLLEDCKEELGIHIPISVVESPAVSSPALLGFLRPRLLLPEELSKVFGPDEMRYVFRHELAHLKRGDVQVNWLISILQILHWFNPMAWVAFHQMRADREAACDAFVMNQSQEGVGKEYGDTIIKLLEFTSQRSWLPGAVGILENKSHLQMRIRMIARFGRNSYRWSALAIALLAVLGAFTLTDGHTVDPEVPSPVKVDRPGRKAQHDEFLKTAHGEQQNQDKKYTEKEVAEHSADFFFQRLGQRPTDGYHYYAAMWALGEKCTAGPDIRRSILGKAISVFNGEHDTNTKIQCMGVMSQAEKIGHSPASYKLILNALHTHDDDRIRGMAAYSLLWYRDQPNVLAELESALKIEEVESVKDSISATIKRIRAYDG